MRSSYGEVTAATWSRSVISSTASSTAERTPPSSTVAPSGATTTSCAEAPLTWGNVPARWSSASWDSVPGMVTSLSSPSPAVAARTPTAPRTRTQPSRTNVRTRTAQRPSEYKADDTQAPWRRRDGEIQRCIRYRNVSDTVTHRQPPVLTWEDRHMAIAGVPAPSPDEPPLSARRERTRERLLDAACDVFSRLGGRAASGETICDAAGVPRGAFYANCASEEELVLARGDRRRRAHLASLEAPVDEPGDSVVDDHGVRPDALRPVVAAVLGDRDDQRRWHLVQTEFELMALRDPQIGAQYNEQQERIRQELLDALRRVLARLGLRFVIPEPEAVDILVGTYVFGVQQGFLAGGQEADDGGAAALLGPLTQLLVTEA